MWSGSFNRDCLNQVDLTIRLMLLILKWNQLYLFAVTTTQKMLLWIAAG